MSVRGGPWGFGDAVMLLLPIAFLVVMVLKPKPMPTAQSLWLAAVILFIIKLWYLEAAPLEACACFIKGCLQALTPCSIVAGAIFLFDCMESSQCLAWMKVQLRVVTNSHPVAEVMLIGYCFAFVVEGASGFGTPAALAAPMLYSMGHPKLECVACLLLFNMFMTIFGAVGTPVWFGIGQVAPDYEDEDLLKVGLRSTIAMAVSGLLVVPYVVRIIVPWPDLRPSLPFVVMSTLSVSGPMVVLSIFTYEFPTILAGIVGLFVTGLLTVFKVGLGPHSRGAKEAQVTESAMEEGKIAGKVGEGGSGSPSTANPEGEDDGKLQQLPPKSESKGSAEQRLPPKTASVSSAEAGLPPKGASQRSGMSGESREGLPKGASQRSLRDRAVNSDVHLSKKDIKNLVARDSMNVPPAEVMSILGDEDEIPAEVQLKVNDEHAEKFNRRPTVLECLGRTSPLWMTVLLLILTRIEPLEIKAFLRRKEPAASGYIGNLGYLSVSAVGRFSLTKILGTNIGWTYELLYTPFILPFVVAGSVGLVLYRKELATPPKQIVLGVVSRIKGPAIALAGALMLVELLRAGDALKDAPAVIIGTRLSETLQDGFLVLSFPLGALGSFFSGSTTVSMLTFTQVQKVAAEKLGLSGHALIGLQLCGASAGNACCLSNIIAATAVIGLNVSEGVIIKRVMLPIFALYIICTAVLIPFIYSA